MEGRAIMYNRQTPGGDLYIPRLKLRIRYLPGDMVVLRGRILPHEVRAWGAANFNCSLYSSKPLG
jgi:hypothetical protein